LRKDSINARRSERATATFTALHPPSSIIAAIFKKALFCKDYLRCGRSFAVAGRRWLVSAKTPLAEAKDKAVDHLRLIAKGIDPKEDRDEKRRVEGARLFGEFADEWRATYETGLKHKAARAKLERIVEVICKPLRKLRLDEIETPHIVGVLKTVWHQREVSRDTRQRIKQIMDAAIAHNLRTTGNPADWDSKLKPIMPKQPKRGSHKAMDYHALPAFMQKLATCFPTS
jgi:hypothetical protein